MQFYFDTTDFEYAIHTWNPFLMMWIFFKWGGFIIFIFEILWMIWDRFVDDKENKWYFRFDFVLLAIDIPKENEQTPKAVESIFSTLTGTLLYHDWLERKFEGQFELPFSFELVSIEGYIQFVVRTPECYRNLIESAFYAQYPEAQITEVEDYTQGYPTEFPNDKYDIWGSEIKLEYEQEYPIKTYPQFEHTLTQKMIDPMASILEGLSQLGPGEQFWFQIVVRASYHDWRDKSMDLVKELVGEKVEKQLGKMGQARQATGDAVTHSLDILMKGASAEMAGYEGTLPSLFKMMTPGELDVVKAIQRKASQVGFKTKMRFLYIAEKDKYNPRAPVSTFEGGILQFRGNDINGLRFGTGNVMTRGPYLFRQLRVDKRKSNLMKAYQFRHWVRGFKEYILTTEELATVYHFPTLEVKAPLVNKVEARVSEPPIGLPTESTGQAARQKKQQQDQEVGIKEREELLTEALQQKKPISQEIKTTGDRPPQDPGHAPNNLPL